MNHVGNLFIVTILLLATIPCAAQQKTDNLKENEVYQVWDCEHLINPDLRDFYAVVFSNELIKTFPQSIKTIIAYYSTYLSPHITIWDEQITAQAFGDFSNLQEAQTILLKASIYSNTLPKIKPDINQQEIDVLYMMKLKGKLLFWYYTNINDRSGTVDEFVINKTGKVQYLKHHENVIIDKVTKKPKLQ